jgi:acyl transferase domain-containing protein/acyl carrier protein
MSNFEREYDGSEVAIIGMVCRFPGARNIDEFWRNLCEGAESVSFFSDDELQPSGVDPAALNSPNYVKAAPVLDDVEMFDASFFGITPAEAEIMDPQQRIFLESAWQALESAGYNPETYAGAIGVFAGSRPNTYLYNLFTNPDLVASLGAFQIGLGNDLAFLTTRVSYKMDLRGPSYSIHTACSTSLVAVHMACASLLVDECQMALAGGIAVNVPQKTGYLYHPGSIMSPDGHCRAFDAKAHGTIFGSGVGIVVLKRLADALADGDHIHAIIKGTACNNDGATKASFAAPGVNGQAAVIADALANGGVEPETISYVEAHGTGTQLGDPIEIRALTKAFTSAESDHLCAIGSVKTNLGHLDSAAGIASLIKTTLALEHRLLPPSLHIERPNPNIGFENTPFYVNAALSVWDAPAPRRAGVSSFGIGGTNAHVVMEQAPDPEPSSDYRPWQLLTISAKTSAALENATANLAQFFQQHSDCDLADAAYTLQVGRKAFNYRRMLVCGNLEDAAKAIKMLDPQRVFTDGGEKSKKPIIFMFPGQGIQYANMCLELYEQEPVFREHIDLCSELLKPYLQTDLRMVLYPGDSGNEVAARELNQTRITQPALFVIEYALAQLWLSCGVAPDAMIGHSIGEYVAACLAGVMTLEEALRLVSVRGRLMQAAGDGAMLAVSLDATELSGMLSEELSLAAINGEKQCVLSGRIANIDAIEAELKARGVQTRRLQTEQAFHSAMMDSALTPFIEEVKKARLRPPQIRYLSNVTGTWINADEATDAGYWGRHLRQTVRFASGLDEIARMGTCILIEVGPGQTLKGLASRYLNGSENRLALASLPARRGSKHELEHFTTTLGKLWLSGVEIDWNKYHANERRHRVPLPVYPFERQRYWIDLKAPDQGKPVKQASLNKKTDIADWFYTPSWKRSSPLDLSVSADQSQTTGCWLIFAGESHLSSAIAKQLKQSHPDSVLVMPGEQFNRLADGAYTINPRAVDDYQSLLIELQILGMIPRKIIHLWNIGSHDSSSLTPESFDEAQFSGFYSLIFLAQTLSGGGSHESVPILVVSSHLHEVTGGEIVRPEKATILGPCKVIPQEYPGLDCRNVDIITPEQGSSQEAELIRQIVAEAITDSDDAVIAYRGRHRWLQTFDPAKMDGGQRVMLREQGCYMILGGLGGVGLLLAEWLAATTQAKLILVGRSAMPPKESWQAVIEAGSEINLIRKINHIQSLEAMGAEVLTLSADVANTEEMQRVFARGVERFGEIHGIIHAAGVAGGGLIQLKTPELADAVLAPKVKGVLALDAILKDFKIDFLVIFSSISAILGEFGQADYCAANAFLDAYAHSRNGDGSRITMSINWPAWKEVGMAVDMASSHMVPDQVKALLLEELESGMASAEGLEAFNRILSNPSSPQVIVSTKDIWAAIERAKSVARTRILEALAQLEFTRASHPRPNLQSPYVAPRNESEEIIAAICQRLLGIDEVGVYDNFFDLGGHSLLANMLVTQMREAFQVDLPLSTLFDAPTVAELAEAVSGVQVEQEDTEKMEILKMLAQLSEEEIETEISKRSESLD